MATPYWAGISLELATNPKMTQKTLIVALCLLRYARYDRRMDAWIAWPSYQTLLKDANSLHDDTLTERTLWRALVKLEKVGVLQRVLPELVDWEVIKHAQKSTVYVFDPRYVMKKIDDTRKGTLYTGLFNILETASKVGCLTDRGTEVLQYWDETPDTSVRYPEDPPDTDDRSKPAVSGDSDPKSQEPPDISGSDPLTPVSGNKTTNKITYNNNNNSMGNLTSNYPESYTQEDLLEEEPPSQLDDLTTGRLSGLTRTALKDTLPTYSKLPRGENGRVLFPEAFNELKSKYPKSSKPFNGKVVYEKWRAALAEGLPAEVMLRAVEAFASAMGGREPRYVTTAANWFTRAQWNEYLEDVEVSEPETGSGTALLLKELFKRQTISDDIRDAAETLDGWGVDEAAVRKAHKMLSAKFRDILWGPKALVNHWPIPVKASAVESEASCQKCGACYNKNQEQAQPACASAGTWEQNAVDCGMLSVVPLRWRQAADRIEWESLNG